MGKSFYDPDYMIELGEKRVEQYNSSYHLRDGQVTKLVIIYSCFGIYLFPIFRDLINDHFDLFSVTTGLFLGCLCVSCVYALRLLYPGELRDLSPGDKYYVQTKREMEKKRIYPSMTPWEVQKERQSIDEFIKDMYMKELKYAQDAFLKDIECKKYLYQRALLWDLLAITPFLLSVFNHIVLKN